MTDVREDAIQELRADAQSFVSHKNPVLRSFQQAMADRYVEGIISMMEPDVVVRPSKDEDYQVNDPNGA